MLWEVVLDRVQKQDVYIYHQELAPTVMEAEGSQDLPPVSRLETQAGSGCQPESEAGQNHVLAHSQAGVGGGSLILGLFDLLRPAVGQLRPAHIREGSLLDSAHHLQ